MQRSLHTLPKQGTDAPWQVVMDYAVDVAQLRRGPVADPALRFSRRPAVPTEPELPVAV